MLIFGGLSIYVVSWLLGCFAFVRFRPEARAGFSVAIAFVLASVTSIVLAPERTFDVWALPFWYAILCGLVFWRLHALYDRQWIEDEDEDETFT